MKKTGLYLRKSFIALVLIILFLQIFTNSVYSEKKDNDSISIFSKLSKEIELSPGEDYYFKFDKKQLELLGEKITPFSSGLSDKTKSAILRCPRWIQRDLCRQFKYVDPQSYTDLLLNSEKKYVDEIAFCIAFSPKGVVPDADLIFDNVKFLYENDKHLKYVDIIDVEMDYGNYYSTVKYRVLENNTIKEFEYPYEIYYKYIVNPKISMENVQYIYDSFWRSYLFYHNDIGYPLLMEKLSCIDYLWDCESYFQPKNRQWNWSMENHPTAIEAVSYWVGKTVPYPAIGDRPGQPIIVAHEHNGWCGELQRIACAGQRSALIPSSPTCNHAEDHVWRDFYERGWHENDNWWSDGGGAVDKPDVYRYSWNKEMSSIFTWDGDDSIYEVTSRYIHDEDRNNVVFTVRDRVFNPVDGVRITVLVRGPTDITWYKYRLLELIYKTWDFIPEFLKGKLLDKIFLWVQQKFIQIPDIIKGVNPSIVNFTNPNGICSFNLGSNLSYVFIIQQGNLKKIYIPARNNQFRIINNLVDDKKINIVFPLLKQRKIKNKNIGELTGDKYSFDISFSTKSFQFQSNIFTDGKGRYNRDGKISFFVVDEKNFKKYKLGLNFKSYNYLDIDKTNTTVSSDNSFYFVFKNTAKNSKILLDLLIISKANDVVDSVNILSPSPYIFDVAMVRLGDIVNISGVSSNENIYLNINGDLKQVFFDKDTWFYNWDTAGLKPGEFEVKAVCGEKIDEITIKIVDTKPPILKIDSPRVGEIFESGFINISGCCWDNYGVEKVEICIDNHVNLVYNMNNWSEKIETSILEFGDNNISIRATDLSGLVTETEHYFVLNKSDSSWKPVINTVYHSPIKINDSSNIIVYANISSFDPVELKNISICWDNGNNTFSRNMFRYGDYPKQERHDEDPLDNLSNKPIYGYDFGQLPSGSNICYWVVASNTANNKVVSDKKCFNVK